MSDRNIQWQQSAGHCAQLSLYLIALQKPLTQTQRQFTWTCCWLLEQLIDCSTWTLATDGLQWTAVCLQTANPDKGQINIGITDYSQRTSPRRWAACRDWDPTAVLMTSHLLQKLSFSCSQTAFHLRTNFWVSEPYRDLQTGSDHCQAQPDMNGGSDHCKAQPDMNVGSDHCTAQPDMNAGSDHCKALRGSWLKTTALPIIPLRFSFRISAGTLTILTGEFRSFLSLSRQYLKKGHDRFFSHPCQLTTHQSTYHCTLYNVC